MPREERGPGRARPDPPDGARRSVGGREAGPLHPAPPAFIPIETKLQAPPAAGHLVRRHRLVERLVRDPVPLVVFSAPAGCGKTLTLRQWLEADPRSWAWLQLDEGDNDPVTLLQYLARALLRVSPLDAAVPAWLELPEPPVTKAILPALVKAASAAPPFVLVLDDTHALRDERCWRMLGALLAALPPGSTLAVSGRSDPSLPLSRLRSLEQVAEYRYGDLVFDDDEIRRLLALHELSVDDDLLAELALVTEGWPAGVYLTVLSWRTGDLGARQLPRVGRREMTAYLHAEILEALAPDVVEFLTRTSIASTLSPGLCNELTGRDDSGWALATIQRDNLFLTSLDDGGAHYRYHHVFRELLQTELERREPAALPGLHLRAAHWFEQEDRVREALRHYFAAGEVGSAADLVAGRWWSRYLTGRVWTARRWVDGFSGDQLGDYPALTVAAAWIFALTGRPDLARSLLSGFDPTALDALPTLDRTSSARSSFALIRALLATDGPFRMREDAREAVRLEGAGPGPWPALCHLVLGVAEMLCGDDRAASGSLELAARQAEVWSNGVDLAALGDLSLLAGDDGDWDAAAEYALETVKRAQAYSTGDYLATTTARLARDRLSARAGDDDAVADMEDVLEESSWDFCPWVGVRTGLLLAEAHLSRADPGNARRSLDSARTILARWFQAPGLARRVTALEQSLRLHSLVEPLSSAELRVLAFMPTNLTAGEIAEQLGVSPNTVGSHIKALHRKLGAGRRSEVVERAAALGLLPSQPPRIDPLLPA
jgi:LuxR family transcriptional regulator, maltose regulon positive regulatory protein